MFHRALAISLKAVGEDHPSTATSYSYLGAALLRQGKSLEAEAMCRHALAYGLKAVGEDHPRTASCYNDLGRMLAAQGKYGEGEAICRRVVATYLKTVGEFSSYTAASYNDLGMSLLRQGKFVEAETMYRHALTIRTKVQGEDHPASAVHYDNLAGALRAQGKYREAEAMYRHSMAIFRKALGEDHPEFATNCQELAIVLKDQEKLPEAEAMYRRALAIRRKTLGEGHLYTSFSYNELASTIDRQGRHDEALKTWELAAASFEQARLRSPKGLESALTWNNSPLQALALALAGAGRTKDAWACWERGLARGLIDEVTGRAGRPLTDEERGREANLLGLAQAIDERIGKYLALKSSSPEQEKPLEDLKSQESDLRRRLLEVEKQFEDKYGARAGKSTTLDDAQNALPEDTALVGWVDTDFRHAACILRHHGEPWWVTVPGSGPDGTWTMEDKVLSSRLRGVLASKGEGDWRATAEQLAKQRLGPLEAHLKGVRRVIVVNSPGLAGVPLEVLFAAQGDAGQPIPVVAYTPSASMLTYLARTVRSGERPATLLSLGDPAYPAAKPDSEKAPAAPEHGLFVARVEPNGIADLFRVKAGDVLLEYNGKTLTTRDDLKVVAADGGPKTVALRLWRAGDVRTLEVAPGPLGVQFDPRPAVAVVLAQRSAAKVLNPVRGDALTRLDGSRREVAAIAGLFPADRVTTILGDDARESVVQGLARAGKLKAFRYLHFAVHGRNDPRSAYRTALLLAPDPDRAADPVAFDTDGEITAEQIARTWDLDADLVVLSACETALGRQAGGEGSLGFAQPLLAKGARSLVLSLWRVDDKATSLLMTRFYQDLLGKRSGLDNKPMAKADALDEAKRWLRGLTAEEVGPAIEALDRGGSRRLAMVPPVAATTLPSPRPSVPRPYEHPYFWAAFILIGDPD